MDIVVQQYSWMVKCHAMPRQVISHPQPGDNLPSYLNITGLPKLNDRSVLTVLLCFAFTCQKYMLQISCRGGWESGLILSKTSIIF